MASITFDHVVKDYGDGVVLEAVRAAVVQRPADPPSFMKAVCQRIKGERPNGQESLEHRNRAVADALAGET